MNAVLAEKIQDLTAENWPTLRGEIFDAAAATGLDGVELNALFSAIAQKLGCPKGAVAEAWRTFLGPAAPERSPALRAAELALAAWEVWRDSEQAGFASEKATGISFALASREAARRLRALFFDAEGAPLGGQGLADALGTLEALALKSEPHTVFTRVAAFEDRIVFDLGDPEGRAVEIRAGGWQILPRAPVKFRRGNTQQPTPLPATGGSLDPLAELLGLEGENWAIFLGFMVGCFTAGPFPLLAITGPQGAGKSLLARVAKGLIDPHRAALVSLPSAEGDLVISAQGAHVLAFDNVSKLSELLADALCRLATGGGIRKRALYTDGDEVALEARRPVVLNGIPDFIDRPDLIDRTLLLELPARTARATEAELFARFEELRPGLLGAIFDAAAYALAHPTPASPTGSRLADWAAWAASCEPALGLPLGSIASAERAARRNMQAAAAEVDPLAAVLLGLPGFACEGPADLLLLALRDEIEARRREAEEGAAFDLPFDPAAFPKNAKALGRRLKRLAPALAALGVEIAPLPRNAESRGWRVRVEGKKK